MYDACEFCILTNYKKWKYTLYTTIIFLFVANPYTYKVSNQYIKNKWITFFVQVLVFTLVLRMIM